MPRLPSKLLISLISIGLFFSMHATDAMAREKSWAVSSGISSALLIDPNQELADTYVNLVAEWWMNEALALVAGGEFAVNGLLEKQLLGGLRFYPVAWESLSPHLAAGVIWQFDPDDTVGWRLAAGVDWNSERLTGWTNLFLSYETNLSFFVEDPSTTLWDFYRLGIKLAF